MDLRLRPLVLSLTLVGVLLGATACIPLPSPRDAESVATPGPTTEESPTDGSSSAAPTTTPTPTSWATRSPNARSSSAPSNCRWTVRPWSR
ncbi:hypothetical protein IFU40_05505 [Microbacterium sp. CFBP 13617]|uniref:hypothetical protein n=1 Tax=Microbacterium sp. CFBP 13617 TaxID=2774035 RepID=UPI00177CF741|nr:hypothetical protein [Microbacterium sp. CFBP 13617]MBD8218092.1 hypothetical protein [Microbacterium sp. CFBP 13617]